MRDAGRGALLAYSDDDSIVAPAGTSGNWVIAAKVELQPRQRLNRPVVMPRVSGRLRA
jgi:hypothetical protein